MVRYANRGQWFEKAIEQTNNMYRRKGLALIDKIPTPINYNPRKKKAFYSGKSTVDFVGCDGNGRMVCFDAKQVNNKSLPFANIQDHQIKYLVQADDLGADAFFLIYFTFNQTCYKMTINQYLYFKERSKRKSVPYDWFEKECELIKSRNGLMFDYIT